MTENKELFQMPGLKPTLDNLQEQLKTSSYYFDHILICGPRGAGKSYFVQTVKEHFRHYSEISNCDCENISKDALNEWVQYDLNEGRVIILDHLEELNQDDYRYLKGLMKKVRVVGIIRDNHSQLPREFIEKFIITVDVPPLFEHRADILYFLARKWPRHKISNMTLMCLCAYHWPGNFCELNRAVQQLFTTGKLPKEIDREIKFRNILLSILNSALNISELNIVIETCFAFVIPPLDEFPFKGLELRFVGNDNSCAIELLLDPNFPFGPDFSIGEAPPATLLSEQEIQLILKSFFQLVFGEFAMLHNENLFDLKPFTGKSLIIIEWYQRVIDQWQIGSACSEARASLPWLNPSFDNSYCPLFHFEKQLTKEQLDAINNFLAACKRACEQNILNNRDLQSDNIQAIENKETVAIAKQEPLTGSPELRDKIYEGRKEITAAFKAHGINVTYSQILNYRKQGLVIKHIFRGKKKIPTVIESTIIAFIYQRELTKNKKK